MAQTTLKKDEGIAIISIVRPEALNALSRTIVDEIDKHIEEIKQDDSVRCIVFYSENNFAAGADIKGMAECNVEEAKNFTFTPTYNKIADLNLPVIAAICGYALGGGMELAMTADIRIAGRSAKMGFPEVTLGIFPGAGGTVRLPKIVGDAFAKELIFTGDVIDADRAWEMRLVNKVTEDDYVFTEAMKLAKRIAKRGPVAVRMAKDVIRHAGEETDQNKAIAIEAEEWAKLFSTYDQKEGMRAFIEKRKPIFINK